MKSGINLYNERSKAVASVVGLLTGAGMACNFLYHQAISVLPPGPWYSFLAVVFAVVGFGVLGFLVDYGFFKTGVHTVSMVISKSTYQSSTLTFLMIFSVLLNSGRLYTTFFLSYQSRHMNAEAMVRDAQTTDVAQVMSTQTSNTEAMVSDYRSELKSLERKINQLESDKGAEVLAENHFNGTNATATEELIWKRYKQGNEWGKNKVANWIKDEKDSANQRRTDVQAMIDNITGSMIAGLPGITDEISQNNARETIREDRQQAIASTFFGLLGAGSIIWQFLITILQALSGDLKEDEKVTVKKVGIVVDDLREWEQRISDQYKEQLTETQEKYMKQFAEIMKQNSERFHELEKAIENNSKPSASGSGSTKKTKPSGRRSGGSNPEKLAIEFIDGHWYKNGLKTTLSDLKNQSYKWVERADNYIQKSKQAGSESDQQRFEDLAKKNREKWETLKKVFDQQGIQYSETQNSVNYA